MSYTPHTWTTGETITASKMNNIEEGLQDASGYDAVISIYHENNSSSAYVPSIISGTYNTIKQKTMNNQPPIILAYIWDDLAGYKGATTMSAIYTYPSELYPNNDFIFTMKMPTSNASTHTSWFGISLAWNSNDIIEIW